MIPLAKTCSLLLLVCIISQVTSVRRQRYDGWFNNMANPKWGAVHSDIMYKVEPAYADMTYKMSGKDRPNAREISNGILAGRSGLPSYQNKTLIFLFTGQMIALDIVRAAQPSCPVEMVSVKIPANDSHFDSETSSLPFLRSAYDTQTGQSPNTPRRPVNHVSSWVDAGFLYGIGDVYANCLRAFTGGALLSQNSTPGFPGLNKIGLPLSTFPTPTEHKKVDLYKLWMLGSPEGHQTPGLTALQIIWYRYHNFLAEKIQMSHPDWRDEMVYHKTRQRVIATWQNIVYNEWLPLLLGEQLPPYEGYQNHIQPAITALFEAAAFRFGHSMVPPGIYIRDEQCHFHRPQNRSALRLCNVYWRSQEMISHYGLENILMGMASQIAEREDHILVDDVRGHAFGPLHSTRHDMGVMNIMRGRDHGLADYNTVRKGLGLKQASSWEDINPRLAAKHPEVILQLREAYDDKLEWLDVYVGGLIECTPDGLGELFTHVIKDQFLRLRAGDRYYFENTDTSGFSKKELEEIRAITIYDVITAVTDIPATSIQRDLFTWKDGDPCPQPSQLVEEDMEKCTPYQSYDYFTGSDIPYIIGFTSLCLFPLLCILSAYCVYKLQTFSFSGGSGEIRHSLSPHARRRMTELISEEKADRTMSATEWVGPNLTRTVNLKLNEEERTFTASSFKKYSRVIDFKRMEDVKIWYNNDKSKNILLIHHPKEYDLVLIFRNEEERTDLVTLLRHSLHGNSLVRYECSEKYIFKKAVTKERRQEMLTKFFRSVFSEAYKMDEIAPVQGTLTECKEVADCELSREEFAEALSLTPDSVFVSQMFCLIDRDSNNYISFRDMIYTVALFTKGSVEDKLHLLFLMYDLDRTGYLSREAVGTMIRSMVDMAQTEVSSDEIEQLRDHMMEDCGLLGKQFLTFDDFLQLMSPHLDKLNNCSLEWKGANYCERRNKKASTSLRGKEGPRRDSILGGVGKDRRESMLGVVGSGSPRPETVLETTGKDSIRSRWSVDMGSLREKAGFGSSSRARDAKADSCAVGSKEEKRNREVLAFKAHRVDYSRLRMLFKPAQHYIENNRKHIFYVFIFFAVCILLFIERFYEYTVEMEHRGFRSLTGYGLSLTRGAAAAMSFCFSLLLLTMCNNLITALRDTLINVYIPFDSHVAFHKLVAYTALFFTVLHIVGYCFNFYQLQTQPLGFLCGFEEIFFGPNELPTFTWWLFGNLTGATGYILVLIICVIYVFATQTSRQYIFKAFWVTHKLFYILYIVVLLHGAARIVQNPYFPYYFIGPAVIFTGDKIISLSRKKRKIDIVHTELLPSNVTLVKFKRPQSFEYKSGQYVRLALLDLGENEYHPFTLTSAPNEDTLSIHVRAAGPWTTNLRSVLDPSKYKDKPFPKLYIDGPFGAGQQDWYRYEVSVLVGGGIGVTPYASILKDFVFMKSVKNMFKIRCKKLYFFWVTGSLRQWEWLIDILRQMESVEQNNVVETHIFITQLFKNFDLRTSLLYICEEHFQRMTNKSIFTGLRATTHFGRPDFRDILPEISERHSKTSKIGVFSCGPPGLTKGVEKACHSTSASCKTMFEHHYENF